MTNTEFLQAVGMEVRVARIRAKMEIKDVVKLTGLHSATISRIERGEGNTLLLNLKRIADALGKDVKDFL